MCSFQCTPGKCWGYTPHIGRHPLPTKIKKNMKKMNVSPPKWVLPGKASFFSPGWDFIRISLLHPSILTHSAPCPLPRHSLLSGTSPHHISRPPPSLWVSNKVKVTSQQGRSKPKNDHISKGRGKALRLLPVPQAMCGNIVHAISNFSFFFEKAVS